MIRTLIRRLLGMPFVLLALVTVVFFIVRLVPGDPAMLIAGVDASVEQVESIRAKLGLDRPVYVQYAKFVWGLLQGDLGESIRARRSAVLWAIEGLQFSAQIALGSMVFAVVAGIIFGMAAAVKRSTWLDASVMVSSLVGISVPVYLTAIVLIMVLGVRYRLLPIAGTGTPAHLVLPVVSLGLIFAGELARVTRSAMLDVLSQDHMRTAQAKGLAYSVCLVKHGLRNASLPILSVVGVQFGRLLGSAVITETVFAWPGLGKLLVDAISWRDYPLIQACILVFGASIILVNLATDITYLLLDPRLRND